MIPFHKQNGSLTSTSRNYPNTKSNSPLKNADALVICTEWQQFRAPDFVEMAAQMRNKIIVDGRNMYQPRKLRAEGWTYISVGRV